ncbi:MAG: hypothetical protein KF800_11290 [Lysobacter sp.]|nr:hypothetical protein [Lysobacter sp.]
MKPLAPAAAPHPATTVRKTTIRLRPYDAPGSVMRIAYTVHRNKARFP